jgi:hypothetical protein
MALEGFLKGYSDDLSSRSGSVIKRYKTADLGNI